MQKRRGKRFPAWLALLLLLVACSASKKALKQAKEYEEAGLYVEAVEADLKALHDNPKFKDALIHLKEVAPRAYDELLRRAVQLEDAESWDEAVAEYEHLDVLLRRIHEHGVVFETINISPHLQHAREKAAAHHFSAAESFYAKHRWQKAAFAYLKAHNYVENYNNAFQKAIEAFFRGGDQLLQEHDYGNAVKTYQRILEVAPGHPEAVTKIAGARYEWGRQLYDEGRFREALEQFENTAEISPGFRDVQRWLDQTYEKAVQYVGIFPFRNQTHAVVDGYLIASEILSRLEAVNLKFAEFLPYADMVALVSQLRRRHPGRPVRTSDILQLAGEEGLTSVVWGAVRELKVTDSPERFREYEDQRTVVVKDSAGNDVERSEPVFYREYVKVRRVKVRMEYLILDVASGRELDRQRYTEEIHDEARWIAYQGSINDLPRAKRRYLDAPREPRPVNVLVEELLAKLSGKIARQIIKFYR